MRCCHLLEVLDIWMLIVILLKIVRSYHGGIHWLHHPRSHVRPLEAVYSRSWTQSCWRKLEALWIGDWTMCLLHLGRWGLSGYSRALWGRQWIFGIAIVLMNEDTSAQLPHSLRRSQDCNRLHLSCAGYSSALVTVWAKRFTQSCAWSFQRTEGLWFKPIHCLIIPSGSCEKPVGIGY